MEDEWIETEEQLSKMNEKQLESLGFPMALRIALVERFSPGEAVEKPSEVKATAAAIKKTDEEAQEVEIRVKSKIEEFARVQGAETASKSLRTISKIV